jgi:hypothetical protein
MAPPGEALNSSAVPAILHEDIEYDFVLIHGTPQIVQHAPNADEHLIKVPCIAGLWPSPSQPLSKVSSRTSDANVGWPRGSPPRPLRQELLDIPQAGAEHMGEPDRMADDLHGNL